MYVVRSALKADETAIIFDDDMRVLTSWDLGTAYNPKVVNICEILQKILNLLLDNCTEM